MISVSANRLGHELTWDFYKRNCQILCDRYKVRCRVSLLTGSSRRRPGVTGAPFCGWRAPVGRFSGMWLPNGPVAGYVRDVYGERVRSCQLCGVDSRRNADNQGGSCFHLAGAGLQRADPTLRDPGLAEGLSGLSRALKRALKVVSELIFDQLLVWVLEISHRSSRHCSHAWSCSFRHDKVSF